MRKKTASTPKAKKVGLAASASLVRLCTRESEKHKASLGKSLHNGSGDTQDGEPACLRFHGLMLSVADMRLLQGPRWLNSRWICFYFAYLQHNRYKAEANLLFMQPTVVETMAQLKSRELRQLLAQYNTSKKLFLFFPLGESCAPAAGRIHWSLLLLSRPDRKFYYYDSVDNCNLMVSRNFYEVMRQPLEANEAAFTLGRCLQQQHDYDSGLHLMCMADHVADYVARCGYGSSTLLVAYDQVQGMRGTLQQLVLSLGGTVPRDRRSEIAPMSP